MINLFYWIKIKFKIYLGRILYYGVPSFCKECGRNVTDFSVDDEIWNKIDPLIKNGHSLCYDCFCKKCKIVGLPEVWKLVKNDQFNLF